MGCDIHLHIEVKVKDIWLHYAAPEVDRSYMLFTKMGNVRRDDGRLELDIKELSDCRGLPNDISDLTRVVYEWEKPDAHSMSWLSSSEIKELSDWWEEIFNKSNYWTSLEEGVLHCYLSGNGFGDFKSNHRDYPPEIEDVRFVFWFDN